MVEGLRRWTLEFRDPAIEREYQAEVSRAVRGAYRLLFGVSSAFWIGLSLVDRHTAGSAGNLRVLEEVRFTVAPCLLAVFAIGWTSSGAFEKLRKLGATAGIALLAWSGIAMGLGIPEPRSFDMQSGPVGVAAVLAMLPAAAAVIGVSRQAIAFILAISTAGAIVVLSRFPAPQNGVTGFWYVASAMLGMLLAREIELAKRGEFLASRKLAAERKRSEDLLYNVLPEAIAERLKHDPSRIAEHFDEATVMFADIAGFTPLSASMAPAELVAILDEIFTELDEIAHRRGLEKIKTIGDAYMVVGGVPTPRADHLEAVAEMALEMRALVANQRFTGDRRLEMRIGIHTGPVVAGVIGKKKLVYDLWGDTVNTASRMESHGEPGRVHVTGEVAERLQESFDLAPRGTIDVKGKGPMQTWFLEAKRASPDVAA